MASAVLLPALAGAAAAGLALAPLAAGGGRRRLVRRARALARQRPEPRPGAAIAPITRAEWLAARAERLAAVVGWRPFRPDAPAQRRRAQRLARAGLRQRHASVLFALAGVAGAGAGLLLGPPVAMLAGLVVGAAGLVLAALAGAVAGAMAPGVWLSNRATRRRQAIARSFPDALDLLVICVEAGLSIDVALARTARELAPAAPELADELQLTAVELSFLPARQDAFSHFHQRVSLEPAAHLVAMLQQTERYGTPLAEALATLAAEQRQAALLRAEERAARLPALLTVPMILFVLPPLFVVLVGPAILQLLAL